MSDDEKLNLRDLPPVKPISVYGGGKRMSQTLAAKLDACPRSAYLYLKYDGGPGSHAMDRGTVVHMGAERMVLELLRTGMPSMVEQALYQGPGGVLVAEDIDRAESEVSQTTKVWVDEILDARPDLCPTSSEADAARQMMFHLAVGFDVDPQTVLGVERKFVLELDCGVVVSGKIDLASSPEPGWAQVDDYKTSYNVPPENEFDELHSFQTKLYALLLVFGNPVEKVDGQEVRLPNEIGPTVGHVRGRQLYPRSRLRELPDGRKVMLSREIVFTRLELADFKLDVERIGRRLLHFLETWKFPAIPGNHCSECPASPECPLPRTLRRYAGTINTHDEAAEALAWAMVQGETRVAPTMKEVKAWAKANGPIVIGDAAYGWTVKLSSSRAFRQRGKRSLQEEFIERALEVSKYGGELNVDEFLRAPSPRNEFGDLKWTAEQVKARREEIEHEFGDGGVAGVDFGDGAAAVGELPGGGDVDG